VRIPSRVVQWLPTVVADELAAGRIAESDGVLTIRPERFDARTLAALAALDPRGADVTERPSAAERARVPEALLSRPDLCELGLQRKAIDAVFRECPVVKLPGYSRPLVRVSDYLALLDRCSYDDRVGDRVRPS
jgi:hypothetical protein